MEATDADNTITKLVLGYLWKIKCRGAYKELLRTSRCFKSENSDSNSLPKYLPTRFRGLTLNDILREYFQICQIVQDKLEVTNFYDEGHTNTSLVYQLRYLINKVQTSRASTPCPRSPPDSNIGETSPYHHADNVSDVEATPAHTLPGNIRCRTEEFYLDKNPKRKTHLKASNMSNEGHSSSPVSDQGDAEVMVDTEMLAQTLLENKEFHEKIAHTINKVAAKQFKESSELNETIKNVVRETEEDPIFDRILDEIIGSTNILENGKGIETSSNASSIEQFADGGKTKKTPKKLNLSQSHQPINLHSESQTVEEQNEEAIRSIIAKSKPVPESQPSSSKEQGNEIIMFDGSLDKYLITNTSSVQPYIMNTMGHVLTNFHGNLQVQQVTPCYRMTKPTTNWSIPAKVITEQDILTMPTVIVTDDRQNSMVPSVLNTPLLQPVQTQTIVPSSTNKPTEVATSREECLTLYSAPGSSKTGLKRVIYPKPTIYIPADVNIQNNSEPSKSTNLPSTNAVPDAASKTSTSKITESKVASSTSELPVAECYVKIDKSVERKDASNKTQHVAGTPPPLANGKKPTPKSGSHIRNLDFSSPQKIITTRKTCTKSKNANKTKSASKILFKPSVDVTKTDSDKTWDTDLRASVPLDKCDAQTPKRLKRRTSLKNNKRKVKKSENAQLNTTADDGKLLEQALQTPIKSKDDGTRKQEFPETIKTKSKQDENNDVSGDNKIKTIISPSKLNASKRNLNTSSNHPAEDKSKFITPDMTRENVTYSIKANRNIISLLKTPVKDRQCPPKTPGIETPIDFNVSAVSNSTPFTKMLQANLKSIDLTSLPTPNIPITPSFPPFTPTIDLISPYSNRPTDYSTPSSYYQPSDNEQNKSLEAHLLEVEKKPVKKGIIQKAVAVTNEYLSTFNKNVIGKKNLSLMKKTMSPNASTSEDSSTTESSNTDDSLFLSMENSSNQTVVMGNKPEEIVSKTYSLRSRNVLNKNSVVKKTTTQGVTEKKTVSKPVRKPLVRNKKSAPKLNKKATEQAAEGPVLHKPTKQEETASKSDAANSDEENSHKNNLDILKLEIEHATKEQVRHKPTKQVTVAECDNKTTTTIKTSEKHDAGSNIEADATQKTNLYTSKLQTAVVASTEKERLQKELDAKRLRVIDRLKKAEEIAIMKTKRRFKLKPIPNVSHIRKKPRKSPSPRKRILKQPSTPTGKELSILLKDLNDSDDDPDLLHDETVRATNQIILETEKFAKSTSDVEAQTLIEGLKERGIHLMHNKLSKPPDNDVAVVIDEAKGNDVTVVNEETRDNITIVTEKVTDNLDSCSATTQQKNDPETKGSNLNSARPVFSKRSFDDDSNFHITFDESQKQSKSIDNDNINILSKTIVGKIFIEEIKREIDISMSHFPFHSLIEIASTTQTVHGSLDTDKNSETDVINFSVENETDDSGKVKKIKIWEDRIIKKAVSSEKKPDMDDEADAAESTNFTQPVEVKAETTRDFADSEHISVFKDDTNEGTAVCLDKTNDSLKGALESVTDSGENLLLEKGASKESTTIKLDAGVEQHMVEKRIPRKYEKIHDCIKETTNADEVVIDDDLMTLALTRREEIPDGSQSPKCSRKRKLKTGDDSHTEKKCKNILMRLDVDSFLNNIHGGSNYYGKN